MKPGREAGSEKESQIRNKAVKGGIHGNKIRSKAHHI